MEKSLNIYTFAEQAAEKLTARIISFVREEADPGEDLFKFFTAEYYRVKCKVFWWIDSECPEIEFGVAHNICTWAMSSACDLLRHLGD